MLITFIIIVVFALWIQFSRTFVKPPDNFVNWIYQFLDDWSLPLSASVMLLLATAAFFSILDNRNARSIESRERLERERRDRKERLLNEIIEWAIDVAKPKYALNLISLTSSTGSIEDQSSALKLGWASDTDMLIVRGNYIDKIVLLFTHNLRIAVEKVRHDLENHAKLINDLIDGKDTSKEIGKHQYALGRAANKVIEEAAKIKTRDIS